MGKLGGLISIAINLVVLLIISIGMESIAAREQPQPSLEVSLHREQPHPSLEVSLRKEYVEMYGYGEDRVSSVLVAGSLLCDTCLDEKAETESLPISGARVAIKCKFGRKMRKLIWAKGSTDEFGDFIVHLPSRLHAIPRLEKLCSVKVLALPRNSPCGHLLSANPKPIRLSSVGNGIRTYTPGKMRFQPFYKASKLCVKKAGDGEQENSW